MRHKRTAHELPRSALLTVNMVAELLAISRDTVYRLVRQGDLVPCRVGERLRFRPEDVDAYLERGSP
jgi:excisionase family DNA binding protein